VQPCSMSKGSDPFPFHSTHGTISLMSSKMVLRIAFVSVLSAAGGLLQGCAHPHDLWPIVNWGRLVVIEDGFFAGGTVATRDGKPFLLSSGDNKLLIKPGTMDLNFIQRRSSSQMTSQLVIATGDGKITLATNSLSLPPQGKFVIPGYQRGQSVDIIGQATRHRGDIVTREESAPCVYGKYGYRPEQKTECDKQGKPCTTSTHDVYGYHTNWPGTQSQKVRYRQYGVSITLDFVDPQAKDRILGHFEGGSSNAEDLLRSEVTGACHG
jgi:hypothetical protein